MPNQCETVSFKNVRSENDSVVVLTIPVDGESLGTAGILSK